MIAAAARSGRTIGAPDVRKRWAREEDHIRCVRQGLPLDSHLTANEARGQHGPLEFLGVPLDFVLG
jgi:hypothetical protein